MYLIDQDTGEIINAVGEGDSVKITRGKSVEYLSTTDKFPFEHFAKLNTDEMKYISKELRPNEVAFLVSLMPYLSYRDNCIKDGRGTPLSEARIADLIGVSRNKVNYLINSLIDMDILCKAKNSSEYQLFMNPWIAGRGNRYNRVLSTMFRHYKIRSQGGVKWEKLIKNESI